MEEPVHQSFFRTHKVLTLLPLAVLTVAILWHVYGRRTEEYAVSETAPAAADPVFPPAGRAAPAQEAAKAISALDIQGSPGFRGRATGALKLIWLADRDTFLFVKKYIYVVRGENKTDFYVDNGVPVAAVSGANAARSLPWLAGVIAHQAFHSYARFGASKKPGVTPPPPGTERPLRVAANPMAVEYTGMAEIQRVEKKAREFQAKVLAMAGGSPAEIREVEKKGPRDFSAGHDGNYLTKP